VKDTGSGISKTNQKKLFQLFGFIRETSDKNTNGIGLGLMISKLLTNEYDGTITFESELHVGTEFVFNLKLQTKEEVEIDRIESAVHGKGDKTSALNIRYQYTWAPKNKTRDVIYVEDF
jgi:two-component system, sensor histidine kinase